MAKNVKQLEAEVLELRKTLETIAKAPSQPEVGEGSVNTLIKFIMDERSRREKTDKAVKNVLDKLNSLEQELTEMEQEISQPYATASREIPLSDQDAKILEIAQRSPRGMVCADDIKAQMNYRGRNAACARLNRLHRLGLLVRHQLGHRVYFKYDAGKTTNTLIISPPQ